MREPRLAAALTRPVVQAAHQRHAQVEQARADGRVEIALGPGRHDTGIEAAAFERRRDPRQGVVLPQHREAQGQHVVRRGGERDELRGLRPCLSDLPGYPRHHVLHRGARGTGRRLAAGQLAQQGHAVAQRGVTRRPRGREQDLLHREAHDGRRRHARGCLVQLVPGAQVMPARHQHVVVARALQALARGRVLPQGLVQGQRGGVATEQRERALFGVHHDEVAVVDLVADFAHAVPFHQPVGADVPLAALVLLGGEGQHRLAACRRLPSPVDDDRRRAGFNGEQAEVAEDASAGGDHARHAHQARRIVGVEGRRHEHRAPEVAGVAPPRAKSRDPGGPAGRRAHGVGHALAVESHERGAGPRHAERASEFVRERRLVHGQGFGCDAEHVVPPEHAHHRFRSEPLALLPFVPRTLAPPPPVLVGGGAGQLRHAHGIAKHAERDHRVAQRHTCVLHRKAVEAAARAEAHVPLDEGHHLRQVRGGGDRRIAGLEQGGQPLRVVHAHEAG